jgi:hypothetical protein
MTNRSPIPIPTERAVLIKSRRRCCLCFWLEGIDKVQQGQIAHLDHDRTNNNEDNLCFLCTKEHHDDYDSRRSQSKGLKKGEVKYYRNELYKEMELRFYSLEVERKLRLAKQAIRKTAHAGLILRAKEALSREEAEKWRAEAVPLVKRFAGDPAEFDFIHCTEGAGEKDLTTISGIRAYLYIHANHLKALARTMDATDLIEIGAEPAH